LINPHPNNSTVTGHNSYPDTSKLQDACVMIIDHLFCFFSAPLRILNTPETKRPKQREQRVPQPNLAGRRDPDIPMYTNRIHKRNVSDRASIPVLRSTSMDTSASTRRRSATNRNHSRQPPRPNQLQAVAQVLPDQFRRLEREHMIFEFLTAMLAVATFTPRYDSTR
jgi:hypothetical protein